MFSTRCHLLIRKVLVINAASISRQMNSGNNGSYYDALGIQPGSTQNDIKQAYYRLSKQFHPDKNQGSETAAIKFREITQAYEVLGNYRLRRLYDKGAIHTAGSEYGRPHMREDIEPEPEDDPQTKFYKSRFRKSQVADNTGRTPIYDFDEWSRQHYGKSFNRRKDAKVKHDIKEAQKVYHEKATQNEILMFGLVFLFVGMYALFAVESSYDTPKERSIRAQTEENLKKR